MRLTYLIVTFYLTFHHFAINAETSFSLGSGYRHDNLDWNIAGIDNIPNILSELEWSNVKMNQVSGSIRQTLLNLCATIEGDYGFVYHGINRDSDYFGDDRTYEFYRSYADASDGHAYDICGGLGLSTNFLISPIEICPQIGYSYHKQHFTMRNGYLAVNRITGELGPFDELNSSYSAHWHGPWLGMDACLNFYCPITIFASFRAHLLCYHAIGHWNLRQDLADDFHHHGFGYGFYGKCGLKYDVSKHFSIGILGSYREFMVCHGKDKSSIRFDFYDDDYLIRTTSTQLNEVNWDSFQIQAYISLKF